VREYEYDVVLLDQEITPHAEAGIRINYYFWF